MTGIVTVIGIVATGLPGAVAGWFAGYQYGLHDYDRAIQRALADQFRLDSLVDEK